MFMVLKLPFCDGGIVGVGGGRVVVWWWWRGGAIGGIGGSVVVKLGFFFEK